MSIIKTIKADQTIPQDYVYLDRAVNGDVIVVHRLMKNEI